MNEILQFPASILLPAILLVVAFPLVLLVLNEAISRFDAAGSPLARTLRTARNSLVPALALLIFVRHVLEWPQQGTAVRLIETAFWVILLYALLGVVNDLVFGLGGRGSWSERVPKLFRDLVRALLVAIGAMVIYSQVWGHEISAALTALGLGSIVIGLALQEPLGNIVSGLMLLFERPLSVGDWIQTGDVRGRVVEINWRSVHIETASRELQIVPNVELYKGTFANLSRPTPLRTEIVNIGFSYDDAPNRVKQVMLDLLRTTPGVLADPPPVVRTAEYADFSINYRLIFSVESQAGLALEYGPGEDVSKPRPTATELLRAHPRFLPAAKEGAQPPRLICFAAGETVLDANHPFDGFALVVGGRASLFASDATGQAVQIGEIGAGECFGDRLTAGGGAEKISIIAMGDLEVVAFADDAIDDLLNKTPSLASEIGDAIEARRQAAQAARRRS
jgi:small-conductance mechanosensitive channel